MTAMLQQCVCIFLVLVFASLTRGGGGRDDEVFTYDPELDMDAIQLITSKGYPAEAHYVNTSDGFILGLQRIPYGRNEKPPKQGRPVVFLQHGLLCASTNWLTNLRNESLGYILADAGFDVWLGNIQLITSKGYPAEAHYVNTSDGFILGLQRIPYGRNEKPPKQGRPVVFLQHGLLCASTNWLTNLRNESLGYILADAGFDVWLGNVRGNTYSKNHTYLKPDQNAFWAWSFDEMAAYDLPSMVNYVLKVSNQKKLSYVGHSQGTTMGFIAFSNNQQLAEKINLFVALAPVANVTNMESPIAYLSHFLPEIQFLLDILGIKEFLPNTELIDLIAKDICNKPNEYMFCKNIIFVLCGYDAKNLNQTRLPVYYTHCPAGTSVQDVLHWAQMVRAGNFQMYDYGAGGNLKKYNQDTPPLYSVDNMEVPVALYSGGEDWLADPTDVDDVTPRLKNVVRNLRLQDYDHLDFVWGMDAASRLYPDVLAMLKKYAV
ncbi:lysosomal acid lipase/cholesteryl ester hydrolase-like [Anneissia japonica]|uniref:lysosomal acid lipase/cholesteryl ester hydrolase-like n=1 Tax=Anneissia japonica TaxID=1529436 RepID=UPI0014255494|nr:lysosomal acid lipase/cholesteryl ester hydrolase-like [Anneissia japonica]